MDHEPPRLKHKGGRLSLAVETLAREFPSDEQVERLYADLCSNLYRDESDSGVRKKLRAAAEPAVDPLDLTQLDLTERPYLAERPYPSERPAETHERRSGAVKRRRRSRAATQGGQQKRRAKAPVQPRIQPTWRMVAFAAAASALMTLGLSSASRTGTPPESSHGPATAQAATDAALIRRELVDWVPPGSTPSSAAASRSATAPSSATSPRSAWTTDSTPGRPTRQHWPRPQLQTLTLENALGPPEVILHEEARPAAFHDSDPWWLSPEAAGGGRLKLNSIPISSVSIDGEKLGRTPIVDAWVPPGKHTVTFDHAMFGRKRRVVVVAPGATEVVAVWFGNEPMH